LNHTKRKSFTL